MKDLDQELKDTDGITRWILHLDIDTHHIDFKAWNEHHDIDQFPLPDIQGHMKWDGCINYTVGCNTIMQHACGAQDAIDRFTLLMTSLEGFGHLMGDAWE